MSNTAKWVLGIVAVLLIFGATFSLLLISMFVGDRGSDDSTSTSGEKIAVVDLKEPIVASEDVVRQFKKYRENRSVKAIVLRVESPGGGVAASQEIYEEVKKTRDAGTPVVVSMGSVAASGGYYVSCGATRIVANPGTLTGSIGVIFQHLHAEQLLEKLGVDAATYKTGRFKDAGSPFRKPTEDDRRLFDQLLGDVYDQFVDVVAKERKLKRSDVLKYADGRVFTGRQAVAWGFVDTLGTYEDAVAIAADLGGIEGKPRVVKEHKRSSFWEEFWTGATADLKGIRDEVFRRSVVEYRMTVP